MWSRMGRFYGWVLVTAVLVAALLTACGAAVSDDPYDLEAADEAASTGVEGVTGTLPVGTALEMTTNLNLRSGPSTGHKVLVVMAKGSRAETVQQTSSGRFYKVEYEGIVGWAHGGYMKVVAIPDEPTDPADPPPSAVCEGFSSKPLLPPSSCNGPGGTTSKTIPSNGLYSSSWFGCYRKADGTIYKDPYDNCEFACGSSGYCAAGQSGPECEADLMWFAADADRYGCGAHLRVTNCANGRSVILVALDRGPNCNSVEKSCSTPVLDMSRPAMEYLFDGGLYGGCDHKRVVVEQVSNATALGPVQ